MTNTSAATITIDNVANQITNSDIDNNNTITYNTSSDNNTTTLTREQRLEKVYNDTINNYKPYFPQQPELRLLVYNIQKQANWCVWVN